VEGRLAARASQDEAEQQQIDAGCRLLLPKVSVEVLAKSFFDGLAILAFVLGC